PHGRAAPGSDARRGAPSSGTDDRCHARLGGAFGLSPRRLRWPAAPFGGRVELSRRARTRAAGPRRPEAGRCVRTPLSEGSRLMITIDDLERAIEAMLFASDEALDARQVAARLGDEMTPGAV